MNIIDQNNQNNFQSNEIDDNVHINSIQNSEKKYNSSVKLQCEYNSNNNHSSYDLQVSNLLCQLKQMSDKQLYLLDIISNLQKNSSEQINSLNNRISSLENKISVKNNFNNSNESEDTNFKLNKALNSNNSYELIQFLGNLNLEQIKKLNMKLIEDVLMKLSLILIEEENYVHEIILFIKRILILNKIKLKEITKKNLHDVFVYAQKNLTNLQDEDFVDISLIFSYLRN